MNGRIANPLRWDRSHIGSKMDHVRTVAVERGEEIDCLHASENFTT